MVKAKDSEEGLLGPVEISRRFGVSRKALLVYERHGLLNAVRSEAGYRLYGSEQLARLHQILVLKRLGLPLAKMGELLHGSLERLDAVLALQQTSLTRRREEAEQGLKVVQEARRRLARGEALSVDDLARLTQQTIQSERLSDEEWQAIFEPLWKRHYTAQQLEQLQRNKMKAGAAHAFSAWPPEAYEIAADIEAASESGDLNAAETKHALARWSGFVDRLTGGNAEMLDRTISVWRDAFADPAIAPRMPLSKKSFEFLLSAASAARLLNNPPRSA